MASRRLGPKQGSCSKPVLADFEEFPSYWRLNAVHVNLLYAGETPESSYGLLSESTLVVGDTEAALKQW